MTDCTSDVNDESRRLDGDLAEARAAAEAAYAAVAAFIPEDALGRCGALMQADRAAGKRAFWSLARLYAPLPDSVRLAQTVADYRALGRA